MPDLPAVRRHGHARTGAGDRLSGDGSADAVRARGAGQVVAVQPAVRAAQLPAEHPRGRKYHQRCPRVPPISSTAST